MTKAQRTKGAMNLLGDAGLEQPCHLVAPDFQSRNLVVMTDAADSEAEAAQDPFGRLDPIRSFSSVTSL